MIAACLARLLLLLLTGPVPFFFLKTSSAKMRFSQVLTSAIAAGVAAAEPLANVLASNNDTLSTLNCKTQTPRPSSLWNRTTDM